MKMWEFEDIPIIKVQKSKQKRSENSFMNESLALNK